MIPGTSWSNCGMLRVLVVVTYAVCPLLRLIAITIIWLMLVLITAYLMAMLLMRLGQCIILFALVLFITGLIDQLNKYSV